MKEELTSEQSEIIAQQLMREIMYDNGMVNKWNPERMHKRFINRIAKSAKAFFDVHPEFINDDDINMMCCGEDTEINEKFRIYPEFKQLDEDLNWFFENY